MRRKQNLQVNRVFGETMTLYATYIANSIKEMVDAVNHL